MLSFPAHKPALEPVRMLLHCSAYMGANRQGMESAKPARLVASVRPPRADVWKRHCRCVQACLLGRVKDKIEHSLGRLADIFRLRCTGLSLPCGCARREGRYDWRGRAVRGRERRGQRGGYLVAAELLHLVEPEQVVELLLRGTARELLLHQVEQLRESKTIRRRACRVEYSRSIASSKLREHGGGWRAV